jgi:hypothetical protein
MLDITATTFQGASVNLKVTRFPDACPCCHYSIEAKFQELAHVVQDDHPTLELVFQCPQRKCQRYFISTYHGQGGMRGASAYYSLVGSLPFEPTEADFTETLTIISPTFCKIFNEAQNAEHQGWTLIAGPGYRKALEFLVKDYLCRLRPADAEKIKSMQLAACIAQFVSDGKVKAMAARAAWLGNDETHYVRKWEDKDLEDLKKLLQLTVHWIEMEELHDSFMKEMPEGKK